VRKVNALHLCLHSSMLVRPNATQEEVEAALDASDGSQLFAQEVSNYDTNNLHDTNLNYS
jgi:t-SNARE complex subunit (syntaxin)